MKLNQSKEWFQRSAALEADHEVGVGCSETCCCGAPTKGRMTDGEPRCCATCAFHPLGCRCKYGDAPDKVNEPPYARNFYGEWD